MRLWGTPSSEKKPLQLDISWHLGFHCYNPTSFGYIEGTHCDCLMVNSKLCGAIPGILSHFPSFSHILLLNSLFLSDGYLIFGYIWCFISRTLPVQSSFSTIFHHFLIIFHYFPSFSHHFPSFPIIFPTISHHFPLFSIIFPTCLMFFGPLPTFFVTSPAGFAASPRCLCSP